ncbi:MAG: hypothetical protein FGM25_02000 [Mycobacterium sp.]|nr:hypothetical protein [Mycobacterium sp.]
MHISVRSHLTAGIAVVGAGALALSPVTPLPQNLATVPTISALAVSLTASQGATVDPITLWIDTLQAASDNLTGLIEDYVANPFPIVQQVIANLITFVGELPNFGTILTQVVNSTLAGLQAPFVANPANISEDPVTSIGPFPVSQSSIWALLPTLLPADVYASLKPILDFTTTPISGVLTGLIGPIVGPVLALTTSAGIIISELSAGNFTAAINELINVPAYVTNAFLNGGENLDLTPILGLLGITLPASVQALGLNMGGLLTGSGVQPGETYGVAFDGLSATASVQLDPRLPAVTVVDPGLPVGPIGALIFADQAVAEAIAVTPGSGAAEPVGAAAAADAAPATSATAGSDDAPAQARADRRTSRGGGKASADASDSDTKSSARGSASRRAG